ncbi:MAG: GNAT family N-acetyltransferase [Hyphomicrobiaceae bacterium]
MVTSSAPVIETQRLSLRPPKLADARALALMLGQWDVARRLAVVPHPYEPLEAERFVAEIEAGTSPYRTAFVITVRPNEIARGMVTLRPTGEVVRLGYYLEPKLWGQGLAREAVEAVIDWAFEVLLDDQEVIEAGVQIDNPASARLLRRLGFKHCGQAVGPCIALGRDVPWDVFRMSRDAWGADAADGAATSDQRY